MESRRSFKKKAAAAAVITALSAALAGCSGGSGENAASTKPEQTGTGKPTAPAVSSKEAPLEVSIMTTLLSPTPAADDNPIKQAIEKATNSKLKIQWVSGNSYNDKMNVTLASGDIPELIYINDPFSQVFRNSVSQGAFWDIAPYIKNYPNLSGKISATAWELTKMQDGGNYGIPRPRPSEGDSFFMIRKDWLDNLGLKVPTTTDELYNVMKSFAEKDPDRNGKNDTVPFAASVDADKMASLGPLESSFTKTNGKWKLQDNKLVYTPLLPETRSSLEYLNKAYKEKLIPEDFASLKPTQVTDLFKSGKAGILTEKAGTVLGYYEPLKLVAPDFKQEDFYPVTNINGYNPKGPGFSGIIAIPKKVPEEKMKRILKLVDTWMNDDVFAFQTYGIEGTHYTVKDGVKVTDSEKLKADNGPDFNQIVYVSDPYASTSGPSLPPKLNELYKKIQDERAKTSVADISIGLYSPTAQKVLAELDKKVQDMKTKVILGREPISAWDSFAASLKNNADVIKMSEEMTEAYKARNGKK
ncbi:extracellular solute-binding protein [Paenibacillus sp. N3.4]|uniref:extracellular solute-binding protein n=1 Tax=Paenibacillus sp. N3.4 TaxID=2603222 RepID=UPI0011CAB884|nr:extracellular solute-binding protein [Paenibacillus sp. N3.4]TXK84568.1 extracellular solute-binding protein [Paenibacillus sp. N3.4]